MANIIRIDRSPYPKPLSGKCGEELQQGFFVELTTLDKTSREIYVATKLTGGKHRVAIHASSVLMYDERQNERDFVLKANEPGRFELLELGDQYTIAENCISGTVNPGDYLVPKADSYQLIKATPGTKTASASVPENAVAYVVAKESFEGQPSITIDII